MCVCVRGIIVVVEGPGPTMVSCTVVCVCVRTPVCVWGVIVVVEGPGPILVICIGVCVCVCARTRAHARALCAECVCVHTSIARLHLLYVVCVHGGIGVDAAIASTLAMPVLMVLDTDIHTQSHTHTVTHTHTRALAVAPGCQCFASDPPTALAACRVAPSSTPRLQARSTRPCSWC